MGVVREWVSASAVYYNTTPEEEAAHLEEWRQHWLAKEEADALRQMQWEKEEEALHLEEEEEERARPAAMPPPQ